MISMNKEQKDWEESLQYEVYTSDIAYWCAGIKVSMGDWVVENSEKIKFNLLNYIYKLVGKIEGSAIVISTAQDEKNLLAWCKKNKFTCTKIRNFNYDGAPTHLCVKQIPKRYYKSFYG
jgi:hypothetical protein